MIRSNQPQSAKRKGANHMKTRTPAQQDLYNLLGNASKDHNGKTRIWGKVEHVSASGMSRSIKLYVVIEGNIQEITGYVANALDKKRDKHWGITVKGAGMDMIHHLIESVSYRIYGTSDIYQNFAYARL